MAKRMWKCPHCDELNELNKRRCTRCKKERPLKKDREDVEVPDPPPADADQGDQDTPSPPTTDADAPSDDEEEWLWLCLNCNFNNRNTDACQGCGQLHPSKRPRRNGNGSAQPNGAPAPPAHAPTPAPHQAPDPPQGGESIVEQVVDMAVQGAQAVAQAAGSMLPTPHRRPSPRRRADPNTLTRVNEEQSRLLREASEGLRAIPDMRREIGTLADRIRDVELRLTNSDPQGQNAGGDPMADDQNQGQRGQRNDRDRNDDRQRRQPEQPQPYKIGKVTYIPNQGGGFLMVDEDGMPIGSVDKDNKVTLINQQQPQQPQVGPQTSQQGGQQQSTFDPRNAI